MVPCLVTSAQPLQRDRRICDDIILRTSDASTVAACSAAGKCQPNIITNSFCSLLRSVVTSRWRKRRAPLKFATEDDDFRVFQVPPPPTAHLRRCNNKTASPSRCCASSVTSFRRSTSSHCALNLAAQCIVIGPVCLQRAGGRCGFVCGYVTTITRNCVRRSSPNWVCIGECSDHLQLVKFWPSCAPGKVVCGGAKIFISALLQPARSVCVYPSAFFRWLWICLRSGYSSDSTSIP